ncbi:MAG: histidine kinase [Labilithrix sp.]|nr:histidine kinase [Labilithrix sp.]
MDAAVEQVEKDLAAIARIEAVPTILRTIREATGLRLTLIARVLPDRWVCAAVYDDMQFGLQVRGELAVETTLCREVMLTREPIVIEHATADPEFCNHATPKLYGFESYIAVPIFRGNGEYFGNVCGLDPSPLPLKDGKTLAQLKLFAELVGLQLDAEERHARKSAALDAAREESTLREQFIAVLGHDVRNPLASIVTGTDLLLKRVTDPADRKVLERLRSSGRRIGALVDDVLDLARGRMGGGIDAKQVDASDLASRLRHVVAEVQAANPSRAVSLVVERDGTVHADPKRLEQLTSNLLANAIQHGRPETPVVVSVGGDDTSLSIAVTNEGAAIPEEAKARLFQPYFRGGQSNHREGLGLGLYIVSEIAKSHGGRVEVTSGGGRTTFTFRMPRAPGT